MNLDYACILCIHNTSFNWFFIATRNDKVTIIACMHMVAKILAASLQQILHVQNPHQECIRTSSDQLISRISGLTSMSNITRLQIYWPCGFYVIWSFQLRYYLPPDRKRRHSILLEIYKHTWRSSVALNQKLWNICFWYERTVPKSSPYICIDSHHPKIMCSWSCLIPLVSKRCHIDSAYTPTVDDLEELDCQDPAPHACWRTSCASE